MITYISTLKEAIFFNYTQVRVNRSFCYLVHLNDPKDEENIFLNILTRCLSLGYPIRMGLEQFWVGYIQDKSNLMALFEGLREKRLTHHYSQYIRITLLLHC